MRSIAPIEIKKETPMNLGTGVRSVQSEDYEQLLFFSVGATAECWQKTANTVTFDGTENVWIKVGKDTFLNVFKD